MNDLFRRVSRGLVYLAVALGALGLYAATEQRADAAIDVVIVTPGCGVLLCSTPAGCVPVLGGAACPAMACGGFLCPSYCGCGPVTGIITGATGCACT